MKLKSALRIGVSLGLLYVFAIFTIPAVTMFFNHPTLRLKPVLFGQPLYKIQIDEHSFNSEATAFGFILSAVIGIAFYYLIQSIFLSGRNML
jgi:hypothetical protein